MDHKQLLKSKSPLPHKSPNNTAINVTLSPVPVSVHKGDTLLAESPAPVVLHEPGYPPRYYFPRLDVKMALLQASDKTTTCPHKGKAEYFHLKGDDSDPQEIAWSYPAPFLDVAEISGYIAFYDNGSGITIS